MKKVILLLLIATWTKSFAQKTNKPNVLLIYTDDHRYSGVHILANQQVNTPHIDQLAKNGIIFDNTYLMGSYLGATCTASRAQLLTGKNLFNLEGTGKTITMKHPPIGKTFLDAGYDAHIVGKWHNDNKSLGEMFNSGGPIMSRAGYLADHFRMPLWDWKANGKYKKDQGYIYINKNGTLSTRKISPNDKKGPFSSEKDGPHTSEIYADHAIKFLNDRTKQEKPFFMYLAFHAPHDPRQAPAKFKKMYPEKDIILPPSYQEQHPFDNGHMAIRDEALAPWPRTPEIAKKELSDYYAIISHLDAQIGRVIETLKANKQYENTLIVLSGDSGLAVGNHGLMGKQNIYDEDGIHVPFIISGGPVPQKGKRYDALSYIHDIYPTICDLAHISPPKTINGKSLTPVINGQKKQVRNYTYHAYRQHQRAYREGDYKLIEFVQAPDYAKKSTTPFISGSKTTLLFNYKKDPWETTNLSFLPEYKEILKKMRSKMRKKAVELNDYKEHNNYPVDFWDYY